MHINERSMSVVEFWQLHAFAVICFNLLCIKHTRIKANSALILYLILAINSMHCVEISKIDVWIPLNGI